MFYDLDPEKQYIAIWRAALSAKESSELHDLLQLDPTKLHALGVAAVLSSTEGRVDRDLFADFCTRAAVVVTGDLATFIARFQITAKHATIDR